MATTKEWFTVDKEGLAKLVERRGKAFLAYELISNCWDTGAKVVAVTLGEIGRAVEINVTDDDAEGFKDLTHAWTLFAESSKKSDPTKRGRFNLGEKLVLALCREASISTTTGTVFFDKAGRREGKLKRESGTHFRATIKMTRAELEETLGAVKTILPPKGVMTVLNSDVIKYREPIALATATLPTELSDAEGIVRRTARKTTVEIIECLAGETPTIYEMGIPVVETEGRWHMNVMQKVPLSMERDNVTPAYLRLLRAAVVNATVDKLTADDAQAAWVRDAGASDEISKEAVEKTMDLRFGSKRVISDPSDPEGTKIAMSQGYTVIPPRAMTGEEWANVRRFGAARPAGQVTPSPKPYSVDGDPLKVVDIKQCSLRVRRMVAFINEVHNRLMGRAAVISIVNDAQWGFRATYGSSGTLTLNVGRLGWAWFEEGGCMREDVLRLLQHEFSHGRVSDHLSSEFHEECCRLGAKLAMLVIDDPKYFEEHR